MKIIVSLATMMVVCIIVTGLWYMYKEKQSLDGGLEDHRDFYSDHKLLSKTMCAVRGHYGSRTSLVREDEEFRYYVNGCIRCTALDREFKVRQDDPNAEQTVTGFTLGGMGYYPTQDERAGINAGYNVGVSVEGGSYNVAIGDSSKPMTINGQWYLNYDAYLKTTGETDMVEEVK